MINFLNNKKLILKKMKKMIFYFNYKMIFIQDLNQ